MIDWKNAGPRERRVQQAIFILCENHPKLLEFLFDEEQASLRDDPEVLIQWSMVFSHDERVLVQVAIDLWCGLGEANLLEVLDTLDRSNSEQFLTCLWYYSEKCVFGRRLFVANEKAAPWTAADSNPLV